MKVMLFALIVGVMGACGPTENASSVAPDAPSCQDIGCVPKPDADKVCAETGICQCPGERPKTVVFCENENHGQGVAP